MKRKARLWISVEVCGNSVQVFLCPPGHGWLRDGAGNSDCYGTFDPATNRVALSWAQPNDIVYESLLHELYHAMWLLSGMGHTIYAADKHGNLEEQTIRLLSPLVYGCYKQAGWIKLPKIPKF